MKKYFVCLLFFLIFSSCVDFGISDQQKNKFPKITKDSILGYWLVADIQTETADPKSEILLESFLSNLKNSLQFNPILFAANGKSKTLNSETNTVDEVSWEFRQPDTIIQTTPNNTIVFKILDFKNNILVFDFIGDTVKNDDIKFLFTLCRINPEFVKVKDLFDPDLNTWRAKAVAKESDDQIKSRVKSLLKYNSSYLNCLYYSPLKAINTKKLNLPFKYYNCGIGILPLNESPDFKTLFYDDEDAQKAFNFLIKAFNTIKYPSKINYVLEYAAFMKAAEKEIL